MKRLIITCGDDDLIKIVGTCLKVNADFTVETLEEPPAKEPRHLNRLPGGETASSVVLGFLKGRGSRMATRTEVGHLLADRGFHPHSVATTISKMRRDGQVEVAGEIVALPNADTNE
jgi:hypothetical protein